MIEGISEENLMRLRRIVARHAPRSGGETRRGDAADAVAVHAALNALAKSTLSPVAEDRAGLVEREAVARIIERAFTRRAPISYSRAAKDAADDLADLLSLAGEERWRAGLAELLEAAEPFVALEERLVSQRLNMVTVEVRRDNLRRLSAAIAKIGAG